MTREIDNFFPGMFDYLNIRVYDDDKTDLLKHWDNTYKYINKARNDGSKVLVHCKMGISRSASVVIAYAMKAFNWHFDKALKHVKAKRSCIKPNTNFLNQLETYQGILDAMKNKEKLQRSKSETNLKSPKNSSKMDNKITDPTPLTLAMTGSYTGRPRSWSPDTKLASELLPPTSVSLENLASSETRHMLMPCASGSYSVSPNQIIRLKEEGALSVKHIVNEIENAASGDKKDVPRRNQRLNFNNVFDNMSSSNAGEQTNKLQSSPLRNVGHKYSQLDNESDRIHTWDPGEAHWINSEETRNPSDSDNIVKSDSGIMDVKLKQNDVIYGSVDRTLDCDERRAVDEDAPPPSRQSSWSSFDSAVVPDLSRHSSWGSYDTRSARPQLPPREDKRPKERPDSPASKPPSDLSIINEHTEPRRGRGACRSPVDISENERKFNETCAILKELASAEVGEERVCGRGAATWGGRLSASAPPDTWLRAGPRRRRLAAASHGDLPRVMPAPPGLVSNLKKEFEARSRGLEDVSVRVLVDRYDAPTRARSESGGGGGGARRPPVAPTVLALAPLHYTDLVVSTVLSKAQTKKQMQHGKTHPLTRLNLNRSNNRCSNPVYNTM